MKITLHHAGLRGPDRLRDDGQTQVHLATRDLGVAFRTRHIVNPLERSHIASPGHERVAIRRCARA
jgi:hypothetical protein